MNDYQKASQLKKEGRGKFSYFNSRNFLMLFLFICLCPFYFSNTLWSISKESLRYPSPPSKRKPSIHLSLKQISLREVDSRSLPSPIIVHNRIIILHAAGILEAINLETGASQWEKGPFAKGAILGAGKEIILLKSGTELIGIKIEDGEIIWTLPFDSEIKNVSKIDEESFAFLLNNSLYRLGLLDGKLEKLTEIGISIEHNTPFVFDGHRYLTIVQNFKFVLLYDLKKEKVKWRFRSGSKITQSPLLVEKTLYILAEDHFIYALKLRNGHQIFRKKMENKLKNPAAKGKGILFLSPFLSKSIYMVELATGSVQKLVSLDSERYHFIARPSCDENYLAATYSDFFSDKSFLIIFEVERKLEEEDLLSQPLK